MLEDDVKKILEQYFHRRTGLYLLYGNYQQAELKQADEELEKDIVRQTCQKVKEHLESIDVENPYEEGTSQYNGFNAGVNLLRKALIASLGVK